MFILKYLVFKKSSEFLPVGYGNKYSDFYDLKQCYQFGLGVRNEAGQRLIEFCQENALAKNALQQQTPSSNNTREDSTHGHHQMVNTEIRLIISFAAKDGEALYKQKQAKTRLGTDCGSDHELLIAKFRLQLKKVGKTTRPFRYDLIKSLMTIQWK